MGSILAHLAQIRVAIFFFFFFFKNLAPSVTRYYGQLLSCTMPKKTNDPILRKISDGLTERRTDGQTERRTDWQTDESDLIGRCPTNAECPKIKRTWKILINIIINFVLKNKKALIVGSLMIPAAKDKTLDINVYPNVDSYKTNKSKG